jgi:hypothetical protein
MPFTSQDANRRASTLADFNVLGITTIGQLPTYMPTAFIFGSARQRCGAMTRATSSNRTITAVPVWSLSTPLAAAIFQHLLQGRRFS